MMVASVLDTAKIREAYFLISELGGCTDLDELTREKCRRNSQNLCDVLSDLQGMPRHEAWEPGE